MLSLASDNLLDDLDAVTALLNEADNDTPENGQLIVANQMDVAGADERLEILTEFYGETFQIYPISAETGEGKDALLEEFYKVLDILRVYPKGTR